MHLICTTIRVFLIGVVVGLENEQWRDQTRCQDKEVRTGWNNDFTGDIGRPLMTKKRKEFYEKYCSKKDWPAFYKKAFSTEKHHGPGTEQTAGKSQLVGNTAVRKKPNPNVQLFRGELETKNSYFNGEFHLESPLSEPPSYEETKYNYSLRNRTIQEEEGNTNSQLYINLNSNTDSADTDLDSSQQKSRCQQTSERHLSITTVQTGDYKKIRDLHYAHSKSLETVNKLKKLNHTGQYNAKDTSCLETKARRKRWNYNEPYLKVMMRQPYKYNGVPTAGKLTNRYYGSYNSPYCYGQKWPPSSWYQNVAKRPVVTTQKMVPHDGLKSNLCWYPAVYSSNRLKTRFAPIDPVAEPSKNDPYQKKFDQSEIDELGEWSRVQEQPFSRWESEDDFGNAGERGPPRGQRFIGSRQVLLPPACHDSRELAGLFWHKGTKSSMGSQTKTCPTTPSTCSGRSKSTTTCTPTPKTCPTTCKLIASSTPLENTPQELAHTVFPKYRPFLPTSRNKQKSRGPARPTTHHHRMKPPTTFGSQTMEHFLRPGALALVDKLGPTGLSYAHSDREISHSCVSPKTKALKATNQSPTPPSPPEEVLTEPDYMEALYNLTKLIAVINQREQTKVSEKRAFLPGVWMSTSRPTIPGPLVRNPRLGRDFVLVNLDALPKAMRVVLPMKPLRQTKAVGKVPDEQLVAYPRLFSAKNEPILVIKPIQNSSDLSPKAISYLLNRIEELKNQDTGLFSDLFGQLKHTSTTPEPQSEGTTPFTVLYLQTSFPLGLRQNIRKALFDLNTSEASSNERQPRTDYLFQNLKKLLAVT